MNEAKKLPDRAELRAAALKRLEQPSSRILAGVVPEGGGYTPDELETLFGVALLERKEAILQVRGGS